MAQLPRRPALDLRLLLLAAALLAAGPAAATDLVGTWHVLAHYRDANSGAPEQLRWQDRVWVFQRKGSKLKWTEYPIVVFGNDSGRFERRQSGQYARVLGAWEPSDSQLANIEAGLKINTRGSKSKSLRGSDEEGWQSTARARAASASVITYQETWSIEDPGGLPRFLQQDVMASARTETLEGLTSYQTTAIEDGGNVLVGRFQRDGTREGSFTMRRSGEVGRLEERDQRAIQQAARERSTAASAHSTASSGVDLIIQETGLRVTSEQREGLVREAVQLLEIGRSPNQVSEALLQSLLRKSYGWAQQGAEHGAGVRYRLPFASDEPRRLRLGFRSDAAAGGSDFDRRDERDRYTLVFELPERSDVVAARAGRVVQAGGRITVLHPDGTFAVYTPIAEASVEQGADVQADRVLGKSGAPGQPQGDRLSFGVYRMVEGGALESLRVRFDDGTAEGFEPSQGASYGGGGAPGADGGAPGADGSP